MVKALKLITQITNYSHDKLVQLTSQLGLHYNDKQLHFLVIGLMGMILFIFVNIIFKVLARYSIMAISFIYTFTVLVVLVFAIEIQQKLTGRGHMEFQDIEQGLWGFLVAFALYLGVVIIFRSTIKFLKYKNIISDEVKQ
ncbi:MAG TPA: hypothetical protein VFC84_17435 [Desulfosporosinus sp.]|nr:hypothetical protein [Desulfosporosinus sp.]